VEGGSLEIELLKPSSMCTIFSALFTTSFLSLLLSLALSMSTRLPRSYIRYAVELKLSGVTHAASMACRQASREGTLSSGEGPPPEGKPEIQQHGIRLEPRIPVNGSSHTEIYVLVYILY